MLELCFHLIMAASFAVVAAIAVDKLKNPQEEPEKETPLVEEEEEK